MTRPAPTAWRVVWWFGFVSLAADMVYEGARSVYGPILAALGASAVVVGLVTGAGEAVALVLRLAFGPIADRTGRYWSLTILGYGLTAVCVPLLALAPRLGVAGLGFAATMILLERLGKAVRSPSKSALLAHVAAAQGEQEEQGDRAGHGQHRHAGPQRSGGDDRRDDQRAGEGAHLVERLVHAEAAPAPHRRGDVRQEGGLRR